MATMTIHPSAGIKMPIKGIQYSNIEFSVVLDKEVPDDKWEDLYDLCTRLLDKTTEEYHTRLSKMIDDKTEEVNNSVRIEIEKEYKDKIELARTEIIKLRKILTDNGISYK